MNQSIQRPTNFDWVEAKKIVDKFEFGVETGRKALPSSTHKDNYRKHTVDNYEMTFSDVLGFELKQYVVFCPTCNSTRQKRIILFNEEEGTAYIKDIIKDEHVTNE